MTSLLRRIFSYSMVGVLTFGQITPSFAQQAYFRMTLGNTTVTPVTGDGSWVPPIDGNHDEPTGALLVEIPASVRARIGVPMNLRLEAQGASGDVEWAIGGASLPAGLSFSTTAGTVTGNPTTRTKVDGLMVRVSDSEGREGFSRRFSIDVQPSPTITFPQALNASDQTDFSAAPTATPVFGSQTWSVEGVLPYGISINASTGRLSGRPQQSGTFADLRLKLVDGDGARATSSPFSIEAVTALSITGMPKTFRIRAGKPFFSPQPQTTGATGALTWSIVDGLVPTGLAIDPRTGILSGTPEEIARTEGVYIRVTQDDDKTSVHGPIVFDVVGDLAAQVQDVYVRIGQSMSATPVPTNGIGNLTWSSVGAPLPTGVSLVESSGRVHGTPTSMGTTEGVQLRALDASDGGQGLSNEFSINVWNPLVALPPGVPSGIVGTPLALDPPTVSGLRGTATWSVIGGLPPGLAFDPTTLNVTGTPTSPGRFALAYRVKDSSDGATADAVVHIDIDPVPVPGAIAFVDHPASFTVRSGGSLTTPTPAVANAHGATTFSLEGTKPSWVHVNGSNGQVYGVAPSVTTTTSFDGIVLKVTDAESRSATTRPFSISVRQPGPLAIDLIGPTLRAKPDLPFSSGLPPVSGGSGAFSYEVSGNLPSWLSLDGATGALVGTPTSSSPTALGLTLTVRDASGGARVTSNVFDVVVSNGSNIPAIEGIGAAYAGQVGKTLRTSRPSVSGFTGPYTFSLASGSLPSWASLDQATGVVSGTPNATGQSGPFSIRVSDASASQTALSIPFIITIAGADPLIATANATYPATSGQPFSMQPTVANAQGEVSWIAASALPEWASLEARNGRIEGTPDTIGITGGIVLRATDATGATAATRAFSIDVSAPPPMTVDTMSSSYVGEIGTALSIAAPGVSRSSGAITWSLASGTLPAWATLSTSTGRITGTPNALGTTQNLSLRATDATGNSAIGNVFSIAVQPATLRVASTPNPSLIRAGAAINTAAPTTSGHNGTISWSLASGNLPPWALLDDETGRIAGTSIDAGNWHGIVLRATETPSGRTANSSPFSIVATSTNPIASITANVEARTYNAVAIQPTASGIIGTPTWRISSGSKPAWLSIDAATGRLTGTPTEIGTITGLVLTVRDSSDGREGATGTLRINVEDGTPSIAIAESSIFRAGKAFTLSPVTTDTVGATSYEITAGALPAWATLNSSTGRIAGTPTNATTAPALRMTVTDSRGISGHSSDFSIASRPALVATLEQESLQIRPGTQILTNAPNVSGVVSSPTWSMTGTLPSGVTLDQTTGVVSGVARSVGNHSISLRVTDPADSTTTVAGSFSISVVDTPKASIVTDTPARVGMPISVQASSSSTIGTTTWRVSSGSLPAWATLDTATGRVSGTPTAVGNTSSAILEVSDAQGLTATTPSFRFSVTPRIRIDLPSSVATARVGRGFSFAPREANGADGAVTWSLVSELPSWASFDPNTGRIAGTPTAVGTFEIAYAATDVAGNTATSGIVAGTVSTNPTVSTSDRSTRVNATFSYQPGISGVVGGFTASSAGNALPSWASIASNTGRIFGTPSGTGTFSGLRVRVVDSEGVAGLSAPFSITVTNGVAVTSAARNDRVRISNNAAVPAATSNGAIGTSTWSLASGTLPRGASVDQSTGAIVGQVSSDGTFSYRLRVTDSHDGAYAFGPESVLTVINTVRVSGVPAEYVAHLGQALVAPAPTPVNTMGSRSWSIVGSLPSWATLSTSTGQLSGTPDVAATTTGLRYRVVDAHDNQSGTSNSFSLRIVPEMLVVNMSTSYSARFGFPFNQATPVAQDAVGTVSWRLSSGSLPSWASLDATTGRISGTPDAVGEWSGLSLEATDATGAKARSVLFDLEAYSEPSITMPTAQQRLRVGTAAAISPTGRGAVGTRIWTVASGSLPPGLSINGTTGRISGTPTTPGSFTATIRMTDGFDGKYAEASLAIGVAEALEISGIEDSYRVRIGQFLTSGQAAIVGARSSITFSSVGAVPNGISFSAGRYSGVATSGQSPATYTVTLTAVDAHDGARVSKTFTISSVGALTASSSSLNVRSGQALPGRSAIVGNALGSVSWSLASGTLPPGTSLNTSTGAITGTIDVSTRTVWSGIVLRATDTDGASVNASAISITVDGDLGLTGPSNGSGVKNTSFSMPALTASNALGNVSWSANGLPAGLSISGSGTRLQTGTISGTPTQSGTFSVVVTARDTLDNSTASHAVSIFVDTVPTISMANVIAIVGTSVSVTPSLADQGNGSISWSLTLANGSSAVSSLPAGLSFNATTGRISGNPTGTTASTLTLYMQAIENRNVNGSTVAVGSNRVSFQLSSNAPSLEITMAAVAADRGSSTSVTPTVKNRLGTGVYYELQVFTMSGSAPTATYSAIGTGSTGTVNTYFPKGMAFDNATGRISGIAEVAFGGTYRYKIYVRENRTINGVSSTSSATSAFFNINVSNWATPTLSVPAVSAQRSSAYTPTTPTVTNSIGSINYRYFELRVYTMSGSAPTASYSSIATTASGTTNTYFPKGMAFDNATGRISGTPETTFGGTYRYKIFYQEGRVVNGSTQYESGESPFFNINVSNWATPTLTMADVSAQRSTAFPAQGPTLSNSVGNINYRYYEIRVYTMSGSAPTAAYGSIAASATGAVNTYFPKGMVFDNATGRISGTPETTFGGTYRYKIFYQEGRVVNGVTYYEPTESPFFNINVSNWATPTLSMPSISTARGVASTPVTPTVSNSIGTINYRYFELRAFTMSGSAPAASYGSISSGSTGAVNTYFPKGMVFDNATGRISGTPEVAFGGTYRYKIFYQEGRVVNGVTYYEPVESPFFNITVSNWATPTLSMTNVSARNGVSFAGQSPTVSNSVGSINYRYYEIRIFTRSGTAPVASYGSISSSSTGTVNTYFPRGMAFDNATGRISGTPQVAFPANYRYKIFYQEGRAVNGTTYYEPTESPFFDITVTN